MANPLANARFLTSAHNGKQLPEDGGREVVFAGRSNAGKSSALNALSGQNALARVSKTPGRTQMLNYFEVREHRYLVDLPGYGYAKVPEKMRTHWLGFINGYFKKRAALCGLVLVMDIRHPLREYDLQILDYAAARDLPAHCLLTKADKLSRSQQHAALLEVRKQLQSRYGDTMQAQVFSSESKLGVDEARFVVGSWLELATAS